MRETSFRYCMLVGAAALGAVAIYYFVSYVELTIALRNSGLRLSLRHSIEALWLTFACHGLLIGLLYLLVAYKPHAVSREVIVLLGLIQLVEAVLMFAMAGNRISSILLAVTALFVLAGALLWPKKALPDEVPPEEAPPEMPAADLPAAEPPFEALPPASADAKLPER
jgi:hypothetical protein